MTTAEKLSHTEGPAAALPLPYSPHQHALIHLVQLTKYLMCALYALHSVLDTEGDSKMTGSHDLTSSVYEDEGKTEISEY